MPTPSDPVVGRLSFEDALAELEAIVERMDSGVLPLEDSIEAYGRGAQLLKHCQASLEAVRQRVQVLEGDLLAPFNQDGAGESDA